MYIPVMLSCDPPISVIFQFLSPLSGMSFPSCYTLSSFFKTLFMSHFFVKLFLSTFTSPVRHSPRPEVITASSLVPAHHGYASIITHINHTVL